MGISACGFSMKQKITYKTISYICQQMQAKSQFEPFYCYGIEYSPPLAKTPHGKNSPRQNKPGLSLSPPILADPLRACSPLLGVPFQKRHRFFSGVRCRSLAAERASPKIQRYQMSLQSRSPESKGGKSLRRLRGTPGE